jgi:hypothetical protein
MASPSSAAVSTIDSLSPSPTCARHSWLGCVLSELDLTASFGLHQRRTRESFTLAITSMSPSRVVERFPRGCLVNALVFLCRQVR